MSFVNRKIKIFKSVPKENIYFKEEYLEFNNIPEDTESGIINIYPDIRYQEVLGFGGAFTESSAFNYSLMSEEQKRDFIKLYFDREKGLGYNFGRLHIGSCDFALDIYTYVEDGDNTLETFNIDRDKKYIIPFLKDALEYCDNEITLLAAPWSPPAYMKDTKNVLNGGKLADEYRRIWALYYVKYIKAYYDEGIKISAISVQNEPHAAPSWESCVYEGDEERYYISDFVLPALDNAGLGFIKIIIWDHNKERMYDRAKIVLEDSKVRDRVWAVAHHWYCGEHFENVRLVNQVLNKPTICTEYCCPYRESDVITFAERYVREMAGNFNNGDIVSCDWNLLLDQNGGPYHNRTVSVKNDDGIILYEETDNGCFAPIIYSKDKMIITPIYYYIGHFSKFMKPGSKVIANTKYTDDLEVCAFTDFDNRTYVVVMNKSESVLPVNIRIEGSVVGMKLPAHSIVTAEIN